MKVFSSNSGKCSLFGERRTNKNAGQRWAWYGSIFLSSPARQDCILFHQWKKYEEKKVEVKFHTDFHGKEMPTA